MREGTMAESPADAIRMSSSNRRIAGGRTSMVRVVRAARTTTRPNRRRTKAGRKRRIKNDFIIVFFV